jgi:(p)ppGpp synthase/HD superfamily hydrolase
MQKFKTLADAIALAEFAHRNQVDKAGLPYIEHPRRVLEKVKAQGALPYVQMAAILHDVTEDTAFTHDMLLDLGFPESAVEIVKLLDRNLSESYWNAIEKNHNNSIWTERWINKTKDDYYYYHIKKNPGALMVKLADIEDNTSPWRIAYLSEDTQMRLGEKYTKAKTILLGV